MGCTFSVDDAGSRRRKKRKSSSRKDKKRSMLRAAATAAPLAQHSEAASSRLGSIIIGDQASTAPSGIRRQALDVLANSDRGHAAMLLGDIDGLRHASASGSNRIGEQVPDEPVSAPSRSFDDGNPLGGAQPAASSARSANASPSISRRGSAVASGRGRGHTRIASRAGSVNSGHHTPPTASQSQIETAVFSERASDGGLTDACSRDVPSSAAGSPRGATSSRQRTTATVTSSAASSNDGTAATAKFRGSRRASTAAPGDRRRSASGLQNFTATSSTVQESSLLGSRSCNVTLGRSGNNNTTNDNSNSSVAASAVQALEEEQKRTKARIVAWLDAVLAEAELSAGESGGLCFDDVPDVDTDATGFDPQECSGAEDAAYVAPGAAPTTATGSSRNNSLVHHGVDASQHQDRVGPANNPLAVGASSL